MIRSVSTKDGSAGHSIAERTFRGRERTTSADPEEGRRLVKAYLGIGSPTLREAVLALIENLAKAGQARE